VPVVAEWMSFADVDRGTCLRDLIRQAKRYHYASKQDMNPVVAMRHNGYAVALVDSALWTYPDEEVKRLTGEDVRALRNDIISVQDKYETVVFKILEELKRQGVKLPF
jgi:hypothetical protein